MSIGAAQKSNNSNSSTFNINGAQSYPFSSAGSSNLSNKNFSESKIENISNPPKAELSNSCCWHSFWRNFCGFFKRFFCCGSSPTVVKTDLDNKIDPKTPKIEEQKQPPSSSFSIPSINLQPTGHNVHKTQYSVKLIRKMLITTEKVVITATCFGKDKIEIHLKKGRLIDQEVDCIILSPGTLETTDSCQMQTEAFSSVTEGNQSPLFVWTSSYVVELKNRAAIANVKVPPYPLATHMLSPVCHPEGLKENYEKNLGLITYQNFQSLAFEPFYVFGLGAFEGFLEKSISILVKLIQANPSLPTEIHLILRDKESDLKIRSNLLT